MVAMVMGCPSRSNHLWYHMFAADELVNTYMTGFMVRERYGEGERKRLMRERERERERERDSAIHKGTDIIGKEGRKN